MYPLDDVSALAEFAQALLGRVGDDPLARSDLIGETQGRTQSGHVRRKPGQAGR
jgi:hypothetical protein